MPNIWGKLVQTQRMNLRIVRVRLSTFRAIQLRVATSASVQLPFLRKLSESYTPHLSPAKIAISPLIEHYFYPVSTAPINNLTLKKLKER